MFLLLQQSLAAQPLLPGIKDVLSSSFSEKELGLIKRGIDALETQGPHKDQTEERYELRTLCSDINRLFGRISNLYSYRIILRNLHTLTRCASSSIIWAA